MSAGCDPEAAQLQAIVAALRLPRDTAGALADGWRESLAGLPTGTPYFLEPSHVEWACREMAFPPDVIPLALPAARHLAGDPACRALAWHFHHCYYESPGYSPDLIRRWPPLDEVLGSDAGMLYLLVLLSGLPRLEQLYAQRAIPERVARDTLGDVDRWMQERRAQRGVPGLWPRILGWFRHHFRGELYHLVRLQFQFGAWQPGFLVFRHRTTGRVLALSEDGVTYRRDGQIDGAGDVYDPAGAWTARLTRDAHTVTGTPISPEGYAERRTLTLPLDEWAPALAPGDPVLHLHIPAGSPMDYDRCGESLRMALEFFPRHFPDRPWKAFTCSSWLLDTQLQDLLPATSNIARFQREMYLLPSRSSGRSTLERVFGHVPTRFADPNDAPRDTTLRRALVDHVLGGGHLRSGRCLLFAQDLRWGEQVYRRQPQPR